MTVVAVPAVRGLGDGGEFVLRVKTDAMAPRINTGDHIIVRPCDAYGPDKILVWEFDDGVTLVRSASPSDSGRVLGVVVGVLWEVGS